MKQAELDLKADLAILKLEKPIPFSDTQKKVIEREFRIKTEYPIPFIESCYNHQLKVLLSEKHNIDFLKYTLKIADSIDRSGNGNSNEKLIIEENSIQEYIQNHISKKQKRFLRKKYGRENLYLALQIDITGRSWFYSLSRPELDVSKPIAQNARSGEQFMEPIIYELVNGKKLFRPRVRNGIPEKTMQMVKLNF
ncbi:hypothetical protein ACEZ3G_05975 [Maribacter algicola]|uniref:Uncharacterized protein n=1 Tax=Meishania litoralis TaxID=3434685 RepID=A0ACC7LM19_9FLAO